MGWISCVVAYGMSFPGYAADSLFQHLRCGTRDGLGEGCLMVQFECAGNRVGTVVGLHLMVASLCAASGCLATPRVDTVSLFSPD